MASNGTTNGGQTGASNGHPEPSTRIRRHSQTPDLHNPTLNSLGRVDVLVARVLKRAMDSSSDPVLKMLYSQFQPAIDGLIHSATKKLNCPGLLRDLGVAPPRKATRVTVRERRASRRRREF